MLTLREFAHVRPVIVPDVLVHLDWYPLTVKPITRVPLSGKSLVWLNWMLGFRSTVNSMPEKVAQFVEPFRREFNVVKP